MQSPVAREHAGIADHQVIMKSIALGWFDDSSPANAAVSERKPLAETVAFIGFKPVPSPSTIWYISGFENVGQP